METLLKDESPLADPSSNLYRVLILTTKVDTETLLKNESTLDGTLWRLMSGSHSDD